MLLSATLIVHVAQLVGPGGMTPYSGGGGGRRHGGYVTISDAVTGFFISGSAIHALNGVYGPRLEDTSSLPPEIAAATVIGAYLHDSSGWILANVRKPDNPRETEWVFFDADRAERFAHKGETLIPSSGKRWWHLHRPSRVAQSETAKGNAGGGGGGSSSSSSSSSSTALRAAADGDDSDELPWQVIGIRDHQRLEMLQRQSRDHATRTARAFQQREALAAPPPAAPSREDGPPGGEEAVESPEAVTSLLEQGEMQSAAQALAAAAASASASDASGWVAAVLHLRSSRISRRLRDFPAAMASLAASMQRFPLFRLALFEKAMVHLDARDPDAAMSAFRRLHGLAPEWPELSSWLVRTHASIVRSQKAAERRKREAAEPLPPPPPPPLPPGCEEAAIGTHEVDESATGDPTDSASASPSKPWCCLRSAEVRCPASADKSNWRSGDLYDDKFAIQQSGNGLSVTRVDGGGTGWGMQLVVLCCTPAAQAELEALESLAQAEAAQAEAQAKAPGAAEATAAAAAAAAVESERFASLDHYEVLQVPCDYDAGELKKRYRSLSLRLHPDRAGGNTEHFARAAAAHDCLADEACRRSFDGGADLNGDESIGGQASFFEAVERQFYPERFPFEPFGDVFEDVRDDGAGRRNRSRARQLERTGVVPAPHSANAVGAPPAKEEL